MPQRTESPESNWRFPLTGSHELTDSDGRQVYVYEEILDPDTNPKKVFNVFCQTDGGTWAVSKRVLSENYVVVKLDKVVELIEQNVDLVGDPTITVSPFKSVWFRKTSQEINLFDDATMKLVFSLVTGIESPEITSPMVVAEVQCANSYDGNSALNFSFSLNITAGVGETSVSYRDYLCLAHLTKRINHTGTIANIEDDIFELQGRVDHVVANLKSIGIDNEINVYIEILTNLFTRDAKRLFSSLCENLVGDFRNLFVVLSIASYCLHKHYDHTRHWRLKSYTSAMYKSLFTSQ